ncbi:MAG: phage tail protein [Magnetospirillum sp. WYHS-4]
MMETIDSRPVARRAIRTAVGTAVAIGGLAAASAPALACGTDPYIGEICYFVTSYCPQGYTLAAGQQMDIRSNAALYSLMGTRFGGDGVNNFNLPDLRGRAAVGAGTGAGLPTVTVGLKVGAPSVTLTNAQTPLVPHAHTATFTGTGGGGGTAGQASGPVSIPVTGSLASQNVSVSGNVKIASSSTTSGTSGVTPNAVLVKGGPTVNIYGASSSFTADTNIGPQQTFSGTLPSTNFSGTASGTVTLPVTGGGGGITGGTVTIAPAGQAASSAVPTVSPGLGMTVCIVTSGIYPVNPN